MAGVPGPELDRDSVALYKRLQPGAFILFGRNIRDPDQLRKLIDDLRELSEIEPVITIDQEGGRVARLKLIGNEPPSAVDLRRKGDPDLIRRHGELTGKLLRLFGFNLNLCPVLDISFDEEADNSLRGRCYGSSPEEVCRNARLFHEAMKTAGVLGCGKHFPGYTFAAMDPHHELPRITRSREELEACELIPFRTLQGELDSLMIGHAVYPALDPSGTPSSLSHPIIHGLLREEIGFNGLVMTDDLDMGAIYHHHSLEEALGRAVAAGNDMVMICHRTEVMEEAAGVLAKLPGSETEPALARLAAWKKRLSPPEDFSLERFAQLDEAIWRLRVEVMGEEAAARRSPEDGKRSPVEIY